MVCFPQEIIKKIFSFLEVPPRISRDFIHCIPICREKKLLHTDIFIHGGNPCMKRYCVCKVVSLEEKLSYYYEFCQKKYIKNF